VSENRLNINRVFLQNIYRPLWKVGPTKIGHHYRRYNNRRTSRMFLLTELQIVSDLVAGI